MSAPVRSGGFIWIGRPEITKITAVDVLDKGYDGIHVNYKSERPTESKIKDIVIYAMAQLNQKIKSGTLDEGEYTYRFRYL